MIFTYKFCHFVISNTSSVWLHRIIIKGFVLCLVAQSCLTLCDLMAYSPPDSFVHGDSPDKNIAVGCHALLQGIFPTQGSNPGLPHYRWILYLLSHQRSPSRRTQFKNYIFSFLKGYKVIRASLVAQLVKNPPVMWETWV